MSGERWPFFFEQVGMRLPEIREGEVSDASLGRMGDGLALVLVVQIVFQELFQVLGRVVDAFLAVAEVSGNFAIARFLKKQRAGRGRFEHPLVALATDAAVKDDPGSAQQLPISVTESVRADNDSPALSQGRQPGQPTQPLALNPRIQLADKQNSRVAELVS